MLYFESEYINLFWAFDSFANNKALYKAFNSAVLLVPFSSYSPYNNIGKSLSLYTANPEPDLPGLFEQAPSQYILIWFKFIFVCTFSSFLILLFTEFSFTWVFSLWASLFENSFNSL